MMKVQNIPFIINTFVTISFFSLNISSLWAECNGIPVSFEKLDYADWILPENQDSLAPTVKITRKDNQSLFNIAQEDGYSGNNGSPVGTLWARSITTDANPGDYVNFVAMHGGSGGGGPQSLIGDTVSLYLPDYGIYFDIEFTAYGGGNTGGAFAWERSCVKEEIIGCQVATACNYNDSATLAGDCTYTDGICESCSGATDGTGTTVDNDADNDGVCDELSSSSTIEPSNFSIVSIYPNPFNPSTTISFTLDQFSNVEMQIYNLRGELIENLLNERLNVGRYSILWNADSYSVGTYLLQIKAGHQVDTRKLVYIK